MTAKPAPDTPAQNLSNGRPAAARTPQQGSVPEFELRSDSGRSAIVAGLVVAALFYLIVPGIPATKTFIHRYFGSHPVEYVSTVLFCVGMSILLKKLKHLRKERDSLQRIQTAFASGRVPGPTPGVDSATATLREWVREVLPITGATSLIRRIHAGFGYVQSRQDGRLEDHLRYLADLASERLQQSFALIRTITWAIPIMGFLGTVLGITIAIANVTPEQLDSSLPEVTAGLAIAFDTTAQALGMSIVLVFSAFIVERSEQDVLNRVEQFGIDHLAGWLSVPDPSTGSKSHGLSGISEWTEAILHQQSDSWALHLSQLQSGWVSALATQSEQLTSSLTKETEETLRGHREAADHSRDTYSEVLHQSTQMFATQMQRSLENFGMRVDSWQHALQTSALSSAAQAEELHRLGRTLLELTESEQRLSQMQKQLNDNLQSLRVVETLEQTVNSLNAAVHVLTAKTSLRAAA